MTTGISESAHPVLPKLQHDPPQDHLRKLALVSLPWLSVLSRVTFSSLCLDHGPLHSQSWGIGQRGCTPVPSLTQPWRVLNKSRHSFCPYGGWSPVEFLQMENPGTQRPRDGPQLLV